MMSNCIKFLLRLHFKQDPTKFNITHIKIYYLIRDLHNAIMDASAAATEYNRKYLKKIRAVETSRGEKNLKTWFQPARTERE